MEESFYQTKKLPKDLHKTLMQRSNNPAWAHFLIMYILFFGTSVWVVISWNQHFLQILFSQICFGLLCCSIFASIHETVHNTAFKSRFMNQFGARLGGLSHLYPATAFQELHFTHHRHTHVPGLDPEISFGNKPLPSVVTSLPSYLGWISGFPMLLFKIFMLFIGAFGMPEFFRKNFFPFIRAGVRGKLAAECIFIVLVHSALVLLAIFVNSGFWGLFTGQVVGHCMLAAYLVPEHNGLTHEGNNILDKTRSMHTNKLVKLWMWNMPYHAEHHAYPAIPFHALPQLHELIKDELLHKEEGYPDFHLKVLKGNFKA